MNVAVRGTAPAALGRTFFARSVHDVAPDLIGAVLLVDGVGGMIVEVEAYDPDDPASHAFRGQTARNTAMFGPPGHAYVYRSYGLHWCLNFVWDAPGHASAVLIRAVMPQLGVDVMRTRRRLEKETLLCAGPGRVCEALGISRAHDGLALDLPPFVILPPEGSVPIAVGTRIGITKAAEKPWRYGLKGSLFLSRKMPDLTPPSIAGRPGDC